MLTERNYHVGETILNVAEGGAAGGIPLLMLPGGTLTWRSFSEFIPELETQWHLFAVDYRGHGKSGRPVSGMYRMVDYLPDILALIEQLTDEPVIPIGLSLGANLAFMLAAEAPNRIRALVALEPGMANVNDIPRKEFPEIYAHCTWLSEGLRTCTSFGEIVAYCKRSNPAMNEEGAQAQACYIQSIAPEVVSCVMNNRFWEQFDFQTILSRVRCPALLVRGDLALGSTVRDSDAAMVTAYIPGSRVAQVHGAGHKILWGDVGRQTLEHVRRFLGTL